MKIIGFLLFVVLFSCSSTPKKSKSKDLSEIKQEDFKKVRVVRYRKSDDILKNVKSEYSEVSNTESLSRVYKLDGDVELKGALGKITKLCYEKKFESAKILISQQSKSYLKNPIFWNQVGTCFLLQDHRRKALLYYNKALALKKNYAPAMNNLGVMYMKEGDFSRALVAFKKAKKSKEFSRTPRYNLAQLYLNFGLYEHGMKELKVLYGLSKKDIDVLNMLGTAYLMQGNYKQSLDVYLRLDRDFMEEAKYGVNFALAHYFSGNTERARDILSDIDHDKLGEWKGYYRHVKKVVGVK